LIDNTNPNESQSVVQSEVETKIQEEVPAVDDEVIDAEEKYNPEETPKDPSMISSPEDDNLEEEVEEASTEIDKTYYESVIHPFETQWAIHRKAEIPKFAIKEQFFDKDV
jgi:hypothetical protein